ncbi:MAG: hypothetical protein AAF830_09980 [Pseudomonadota bacterium]
MEERSIRINSTLAATFFAAGLGLVAQSLFATLRAQYIVGAIVFLIGMAFLVFAWGAFRRATGPRPQSWTLPQAFYWLSDGKVYSPQVSLERFVADEVFERQERAYTDRGLDFDGAPNGLTREELDEIKNKKIVILPWIYEAAARGDISVKSALYHNQLVYDFEIPPSLFLSTMSFSTHTHGYLLKSGLINERFFNPIMSSEQIMNLKGNPPIDPELRSHWDDNVEEYGMHAAKKDPDWVLIWRALRG